MNTQFIDLFKQNASLDAQGRRDLVKAFNKVIVFDPLFNKNDDQKVIPGEIESILQQYGPFWVTIDADPGIGRQRHAVVVTDISKDLEPEKAKIKYYDVTDSKNIYEVNFSDFVSWVKSAKLYDDDLETAIIRLKEPIGEGKSPQKLKIKFKNTLLNFSIPLEGWEFKITRLGKEIVKGQLDNSGACNINFELVSQDGIYEISFPKKENEIIDYSIENILNIEYIPTGIDSAKDKFINLEEAKTFVKNWIKRVVQSETREFVIQGPNVFRFKVKDKKIFQSYVGLLEYMIPLNYEEILKDIPLLNYQINISNNKELSYLTRPLRINSPNQNQTANNRKPEIIILHNEGGGGSIKSLINTFLFPNRETDKKKNGTSSHFTINTDGFLFMMVHPDASAIHAGSGTGKPEWWNTWYRIITKNDGLNENILAPIDEININSIGIDLITEGKPYTEAMYNTLIGLLKNLIKKYPSIKPNMIVGHSDLNIKDRSDPGREFNWKKLEAEGLSLCPKRKGNIEEIYSGFFKKYPNSIIAKGDNIPQTEKYSLEEKQELLISIKKDLVSIGYSIGITEWDEARKGNGIRNYTSVYDSGFEKTIISFKKHFFSIGSGLESLNPLDGKSFDVNTALLIWNYSNIDK